MAISIDPEDFNECEVFVSKDGLNRAAIVLTKSGHYRFIFHHIWSEETKKKYNVSPSGRISWFGDVTPKEILYRYSRMDGSLFNDVNDARRELLSTALFSDAVCVKPATDG